MKIDQSEQSIICTVTQRIVQPESTIDRNVMQKREQKKIKDS